MEIRTRAPSRVGLAGNPSDGYGGRAVALALENFEAWSAIETEAGIRITSERDGDLVLASPAEAIARADSHAVPHRLALAACRRFFSFANEGGFIPGTPDPSQGFRLVYGSDIPEMVGLGGSSALAVSILRALGARYGVPIPDDHLPTVALEVETVELGIHAGLMDRVAQVWGGLTWMDLSEDLLQASGNGRYERLPVDALPPLYVAWKKGLAAGSETVHNSLRDRYMSGEPMVLETMRELAAAADRARVCLLEGRPADLATVMDDTFDLRCRMLDVGEGNRRLVEIGRQWGAGVNQAGSGGAVVGAYDGDPGRLACLRTSYDEFGARLVVPTWPEAQTGGSTGT